MRLPNDLKNYRAPDAFQLIEKCDAFDLFWLTILLALFLGGCAAPMTTQEHEERHCEGYSHNLPRKDDAAIAYTWTKVREASLKPWLYIRVEDVNTICRMLDADAAGTLRYIKGCAMWQPANCIIILPQEKP